MNDGLIPPEWLTVAATTVEEGIECIIVAFGVSFWRSWNEREEEKERRSMFLDRRRTHRSCKCDNLLVDHISEYTEFTYNSISFDEKDLTPEHTAWFYKWQEGVFNKQEKDHGRYERKKDEEIDEQYQHAMGVEKDNFLALRRKNAIMVSERDKKINQKPQASQNEKEMLKEQVEEPKIQVQECQVKI
ncbi:hypothetical protein GQ457_04G015380 [Hibiscus cannabinus]